MSDEESNSAEGKEISFEEEKQKSLEILSQVINSNSSTIKQKAESDITTKESISIPDSKRTYEIDDSKLKSMFDKTSDSTNTSNTNGKFQFQFFNNKEPIVLPVPKIFSTSNGKSKISSNKPGDASSDDDDDRMKSSLSEEIEIKNQTFFFFDIDNRLKDGLENFVRTEEINELERAWPTKRKEIGEALRTKHRKAIQRKDQHRVFNHRRRQNQYSSSKSNKD